MKIRIFVLSIIIFSTATGIYGQNPAPVQNADPMANISGDIARIAASVSTLNERMKAFVDKFADVGGFKLSEKQQRLIMGLEILVRAEQRVATLQKFQIDLVEKEGTTRARLAQVERDLKPQSIDRSVVFEGSTQTEEIRESKRQTLQAERVSLQALLQQIQSNLSDASSQVREAQSLAQRLRRTFLPQIERELGEQ
ncbi:MAG: hypothetical protein ACR2M8_13180 [Pyrinomonadaceae bacterium]|jgi:hypothetical protein|nr:hypothetical protein [Blastocatellia bacterium]